jgi:hypothetical protein
MPSRDPHWQTVRDLEDALALLSAVEDRCRIIRQQIWHEGDLTVAYTEATHMKHELACLKAHLSQHWETIYHQAQHQG